MEALDWDQSLALAKRTGAEVLAVDEADPAWGSLHDWLRGKFPAPLALQVWVRNQGEPGLLDAEKMAAPQSQGEKGREIRHKVLLHWRRSAPVSSAHPIEGVTAPDGMPPAAPGDTPLGIPEAQEP
jgi:hypothetical protein